MTITYSELAEPLLSFLEADVNNTAALASSLLTPIIYNSDLFADNLSWYSGNYGFDGYLGVPGLQSSNPQQAAADSNVAWQNVDSDLNPAQRALTAASSILGASNSYETNLVLADTMPLVFSHPVFPPSMNADGSDFLVTMNDGTTVSPDAAGFLPNLEYNERQTVVIMGDFGNRLTPDDPDAQYPISVDVINDGTPLEMLSKTGPVDAVGLSINSKHPYVEGNGPTLVAAKLNRFSDLGEGGPSGIGASSQNNSGSDLYGDEAEFRLRLYTSAGFSPDGISSLMPNEFSRYFQLIAHADNGNTVVLTETGVPYSIGNLGSVVIIGLADLAPSGTTVDAAYVEDHDNYYDIILKGDQAAIEALTDVRMPSQDGYSPVYNPGGPGNDPGAPGAAPGPFTVPSEDHTTPISIDLSHSNQVTLIEIDGPVLRNPWNRTPVGALQGVAVEDNVTGQIIKAYTDPEGQRFYCSFDASPDVATDLPRNRQEFLPIDLIDTTGLDTGDDVQLTGSFSRSAHDDSVLQWYEVSDPEGSVHDSLSGATFKPEDDGYMDAALRNAASIEDNRLELSHTEIEPLNLTLKGGRFYAPLITNQRSGNHYVAFAAANGDGLDHFTSFGANRWGVEDLFGGGDFDFDDMIVNFSLKV